jgi:serine/threonine protein kinase
MRELVRVSEVWDSTFTRFLHTVILWKEDDDFFRVEHPCQLGSETSLEKDLEYLHAPSPLPMSRILGRWDDGLTEAPSPLPEDVFIKSPNLLDYCEDGLCLGVAMIAEAKIFEILRQNPHRNICTYYGCVREGDYVTGLALKRYKCTLEEAVQSNIISDNMAVLEGILDGVNFLHSLGLVHSDLNPYNIMLDYDGTPVLVDFDSCKREGEELYRKSGSPGWCKPFDVVMRSMDFYALGLIERYLDGDYNGEDLMCEGVDVREFWNKVDGKD